MQTTDSTSRNGQNKRGKRSAPPAALLVEAWFSHQGDLVSEARLLDRFIGDKIADLFNQRR
jgi:hypothetical protein